MKLNSIFNFRSTKEFKETKKQIISRFLGLNKLKADREPVVQVTFTL